MGGRARAKRSHLAQSPICCLAALIVKPIFADEQVACAVHGDTSKRAQASLRRRPSVAGEIVHASQAGYARESHRVPTQPAAGKGEGGPAHLANMSLAPVVAVVIAIAGVPVARWLSSGCANAVVRMRECHAENDDGREADDKKGESAHSADLVRWIREWRHNSSLILRFGGT